ncbi:MAG: hypothetical protein L3J56_13980 [Bacteroidales bacterium]|nr:hypothetical protein [Bacteroidales bacterium]
MNNKFKYIKFILASIIGFTLISHTVIPHDHHFGHNYSEHHDVHNGSNEEPIHCYYLNNIDFDKVRTNSFTKTFKELPGIFAIIISDLFSISLNYQTNNFINANNNLPDYFSLISISPTRGSPLL